MEYRRLGDSGLKVSTLCLGAMTFGEADAKSFMHQASCDEATSHAIMDRAFERGINFIDTADVYGQDGLSERVVGAWLAKGNRERAVIATKFRFRMGQDANGTGASRYRIVRTVEASLRRLQTDRIDLYQIHMQDLDTPEEETLRALDDLVSAGKVVYVGASNYAAYRLADSQWIAKTKGYSRFVGLQAQYSLGVRDLEREHVPLCLSHGVGILPWSPLAGGILSGKYRKDSPPPSDGRFSAKAWKDRFAKVDDRTWRIVDVLVATAKELETTPSKLALAWLLKKPAVTSVIFGARNLEQLDDNLGAAELAIPDAAFSRLEEVSKPTLGYPYDFISGIHGRW